VTSAPTDETQPGQLTGQRLSSVCLESLVVARSTGRAHRSSHLDCDTRRIFDRQQRQERRANIRTALTLFIITATFIVMYLPSIIISLFAVKPAEYRDVFFLLYYVNSAVSPPDSFDARVRVPLVVLVQSAHLLIHQRQLPQRHPPYLRMSQTRSSCTNLLTHVRGPRRPAVPLEQTRHLLVRRRRRWATRRAASKRRSTVDGWKSTRDQQ
jgi:hypothetical protein